ncbi:MAG: bifunctional oligoribonuclease/PAP phosphatase NrnA [Epsilonproteobacteria bacterium]|nr:bifunctional oligoribonuclease/PAP phosphatase NrnA [Campylobacterota bacterium]
MAQTESDAVIEAVAKASRVVITGHVDPDADAVGSALGLYWALKEAGVRVDTVFGSELPRELRPLPGFVKIRQTLPPSTDLVISVDCGSADRLDATVPDGVDLVNIDHHRSNERFGRWNLVDPEAVCAAEVVYRLIRQAGWPVNGASAQSLYTALASDSGFFGFEGVGAETFDLAGRLIALGADPVMAAGMLRENRSLARVRLMAEALGTLRLALGGRVAWVRVDRSMFERTGARDGDTDEIVDFARSLATVEVGFLIRQNRDGSLKVSLRSKRRVDVGRIAVDFGGGGHRRAAGFAVRMSEEALLARLFETLADHIDEEGVE